MSYYTFGKHQAYSCWAGGVEAAKLDRVGLDFLADTGVSSLKGKHDGNKEVYFVDTISNNTGHK